MKQREHSYYMRCALRLAQKAAGKTSPNPLVGAVVVKAGKIIASGYHKKAGEAHAEAHALSEAGSEARGAVLYVTLEPCAHHGRTPPCLDQVLKSGVREVVVAMRDPDRRTNGRSIRMLRRRGITVTEGVCAEEAARMNEAFIKYSTTGLPFVTVKVGQSLDGKIATHNGNSKWITSEGARSFSRRRRRLYDGIMVGVETLLKDNPGLDAEPTGRGPVKVIVDTQLRTPPDARIFASKTHVIIATASCSVRSRAAFYGKAVLVTLPRKRGRIDLRRLLRELSRRNITSILVEGGGALIGSLFDERLVDKVSFYVSPRIIGGREAVGSVMGAGADCIAASARLEQVTVRRLTGDILIEGRVCFPG